MRISPLKGLSSYFYILENPYHKDALYKVWLNLPSGSSKKVKSGQTVVRWTTSDQKSSFEHSVQVS